MENVFTSLKVRILTINTANCTKGKWDHRNQQSPFCRLYQTLSGDGTARHNGKTYRLVPGKLFLIPSHTIFDVYTHSQLQQFYVHFKAEFLNGLDIFHFFGCNYEISLTDKPLLKSLSGHLRQIYLSSSPAHIIEIEGIMRIIAAGFLRSEQFQAGNDRLDGIMRFQQVLAYMDRNLEKPLTLEELADIEHLQPTYFSNLFSRHMGSPPMQYLNRKRIEKACEMLVTTNIPLCDIAGEIGYNDVYYFGRMFKKYIGISPGVYRKRQNRLIS